MGRRKKYNKKRNFESNKVIRCKNKMMPVFEKDTCKNFIQKEGSEGKQNCKHCQYSF